MCKVFAIEHTEDNLIVFYVDSESINGSMGCAVPDKSACFVRYDLNSYAKRYTRYHELYHLRDKRRWGGIIGYELRAEFHALRQDPVCFIYLVVNFLTSPERMKRFFFYIIGRDAK